MRCKGCNVILSNRETQRVDVVVEGKKVYSELCSKCQCQAEIKYSMLDHDYEHAFATEHIGVEVSTLSEHL